jgi:hypothetical protein
MSMPYSFLELADVQARLCNITSGRDHFSQGGLGELLVVPDAQVIGVPAYSFPFGGPDAAITQPLTLASGATIYRFGFTPETGTFTEPSQENDDGVYYDQVITVQIPKDRPSITWLKERMRYGRYTCIYRDRNGQVKYLPGMRAKWDLDTKAKPDDYGGHTLYFRRASATPALHIEIEGLGSDLVAGVFDVAVLRLDTHILNLPAGWVAGQSFTLPFAPVSSEAPIVLYNEALKLRPGDHYTITGSTITLLFADVPDVEPGLLHFLVPYYGSSGPIASFVQHSATLTSTYASGQTIALPSPPTDTEHLLVHLNDTVVLRAGVHFTLSGSTITLLIGATLASGQEDVFSFFYTTAGTALTVVGFRQYTVRESIALHSGYTFTLPHEPVAGSLLIWYNDALLLREAEHYNLNDNEIELLFDIDESTVDAPTVLDCWYAFA